MLDICIIASSSSGNCYMVSDGHTKILLECGVSIATIAKQLPCRVSDLDGCLITHEHRDHSRAVVDLLSYAIPVYLSKGTAEAMELKDHHRLSVLVQTDERYRQFDVGSFVVLAFGVKHDAAEPIGFLLYSKVSGDKLLFVTDSYYVPIRFNGLSYIMIECNYALDLLNESLAAGDLSEVLRKRILYSHMSLETCKKFFRANDLSRVKEIYLLHLSDSHSDEARFQREVSEVTGYPVYVARK